MDLFCHISLAPGLNTCLKAGFLASILTSGTQPKHTLLSHRKTIVSHLKVTISSDYVVVGVFIRKSVTVGFHVQIFILGCIYACKLGPFKNSNGFLAHVSLFHHVIASFNFIVCGSKLFLASRSSLQSGNICKSIFCPVFYYRSAFSSHVFLFLFLVEPRSITQSSIGSSSLTQQSVSSNF